MKKYIYVIKEFYSKSRLYLIIYMLTNLFCVPLSLMQLYFTKCVIDMMQSDVSNFSYHNTFRTTILLCIIMCCSSINSSMRALSNTQLTEIGLCEQERKLIVKSGKLSALDLDMPECKTLREKANKFKLFEMLDQWTSLTVCLAKIVAFAVILIYFKCIIISIITAIVLVIQFAANKKFNIKIQGVYYQQISINKLIAYIFQLLVSRDTIREIRAYQMFGYLKDKLKKVSIEQFNTVFKETSKVELFRIGIESIVGILNTLSIGILLFVLSKNGYSAAIFIILFQISGQLFSLIPEAINTYINLGENCIHFEQYMKYLNLEEKGEADQKILDDENVSIKIKNLTFKYPENDHNSLVDVNLEIKPGEKVAFVGENGSGKTTLVNIILGNYQVENKDAIQYFKGDQEFEMSKIIKPARVVFQDYLKLHCKLRENIGIGDIEKVDDDDALLEVLKKTDNEKFSAILNELIGPEFGGRELSGGQWQRIALSRAYMSNGAISIFDEPTASLDANAELDVFNSFLKLSENKTSIIVTHRLFMTRYVDKIFMFEKGRVVEVGSHEELMNLHGKYEKMFQMQSSLYV